MARTRQKEIGVRRVRTKEERKRPGVFTRLKQGEHFKAVALFEPDPELDDNFGYFEYYDHYDERANSYVPCTGDACPFCEANKNPSTRGLTLWYFPEADEGERLKLFTMNFSTINDATDEAEDEGGMIGRTVRIKRMDDRGDYKVRILDDKALTKKEIAKLLKEAEALFKDGLEGVVDKQLRAQLERLKALDALDDDDDDEDEDEEETKPKSRRGKAISKDDDDDEEEEEDDDEEEEEDDDSDDDSDDDDSDDDDDDEEESDDEDENDDDDDEESDDEEEESDDDDDDDEDEEEEAAEIKGGVYEVVSVNEKQETFNVKNDDGKLKLWLGAGVDVDYDKVKKGATITVDALQDEEGDWVITKIAAKAKRGRPKGSGGGKGKGKGKK